MKVGKRGVIANRTDEDFSQFNKVVVEKSATDRRKLQAGLEEHYVFTDRTPKLIHDIVDVMKPETFASGQDIIKQGDSGDLFYVMISGSAWVLVDGNNVHQYQDSAAFGELALMSSDKRAATVTAVEATTVLALDRATFTRLLGPLSSYMSEAASAARVA